MQALAAGAHGYESMPALAVQGCNPVNLLPNPNSAMSTSEQLRRTIARRMALNDYSNAFQAASEVSMVPTSADLNDTTLTATVPQPVSLAAELHKLEEQTSGLQSAAGKGQEPDILARLHRI